MSKSVRIRDHLYAEIERLAKDEKRSLISQLEVLLEQALKMEGSLSERDSGAEGMTTSQPEGVGRISEDARGPKAQPSRTRSESDFKGPDFK